MSGGGEKERMSREGKGISRKKRKPRSCKKMKERKDVLIKK